MSVQREISRVIAQQTSRAALSSTGCQTDFFSRKQSWFGISLPYYWNKFAFPMFFKFFRGPAERYKMAEISHWCRIHGLLFDDLACERQPVIERALELLPYDLKVDRFRRMYRGAHMEYLRLYLPISEQNYDPFIPYLAPFVEEAKFQLQEEEELLGFHPYDRRVAYCGVSGLGEQNRGQHLLNIGA